MASKQVDDDVLIYDEEEIDWLAEAYHGIVIGSRGRTIRKIQENSGATVTVKNGKCYTFGTEDERNKSKALIFEIIYAKLNTFDADHLNVAVRNCMSCAPSGFVCARRSSCSELEVVRLRRKCVAFA